MLDLYYSFYFTYLISEDLNYLLISCFSDKLQLIILFYILFSLFILFIIRNIFVCVIFPILNLQIEITLI